MRLRTLWCVLAMLAPVAAGGRELGPGDAQTLFHDGRFIDAAEAARADAASADEQALAAKSYAAAAVLSEDRADAQRWTEEARAHAEAAVALDPKHVEGRLQLAVALWLACRDRGDFQAYAEGMPQEGRRLIESVIADSPDEPWAYALLGAWHFEALRRGGRMAKRVVGADLAAGADAFDRAEALAPGDAAIAVQAGLSYLALDPDRYGAQAELILKRALAIPPEDAFDEAMQDRAREALALIESDDTKALAGAIEHWFGG
jgi:hypothetical protein